MRNRKKEFQETSTFMLRGILSIMNKSNEKDKHAEVWPDALDAMTAAPDNHKVLVENDRVRVLDTKIAPGATVPLHTHCWPSVMYVLSFSDFIRYDDHGGILLDSRELSTKPRPGEAMWSAPLQPHTLRNIGSDDLHVISVELKSA
jgi:mannose-6-phosphate isomerase-like protein (cupin superfamily)